MLYIKGSAKDDCSDPKEYSFSVWGWEGFSEPNDQK